ncbi:hypothetical protein FANTH_361 [Fusarium anthophilum]|uniref:Uncharacterized protein n=1 Tax=Fusarium anthophilum TaxID=48485 RepID=A0A8H5A070_9HYPO|nr:hypothetical protein FANTH_361 [Fusarium anthophilum]
MMAQIAHTRLGAREAVTARTVLVTAGYSTLRHHPPEGIIWAPNPDGHDAGALGVNARKVHRDKSSADAPIARVQSRPRQPPKVNGPHGSHRPSSIPDISNCQYCISHLQRQALIHHYQSTIARHDAHTTTTRRCPDDDRRVPNDRRRPSKLAPTMQVPFTNERANERRNNESDRRLR